MLEVVEDDEHVREHERHVGEPQRIRRGVAEGLDAADEVVAEEAHRAPGEGRRVGHRGLVEASGVVGGEGVRDPPRPRATNGGPHGDGSR